MIVYDIEIKKAILGKNEKPRDGIDYCEGWYDYKGMGISCICCYDYVENRYRTFMEDNMRDFILLLESRKTFVGFNNIRFDNKVIAHAVGNENIDPKKLSEWAMPTDSVNAKRYLNKKSYDILAEILNAGGGWCSLDAMIKENNLAAGKTGNGALAPIWYQEGRIGKLVDYCMADVWLTKKLLDKIIQGEALISSKTGQRINIRKP